MQTVRYHCSHCNHQFEDEEKDVLECPKCFWSSSVSRVGQKDSTKDFLAQTKVDKPKRKVDLGPVFGLGLKAIFILIVLVALGFGGWKAYLWLQNKEFKVSLPNKTTQEKISISSEELTAGPDLSFENLPPEAQNILNRRTQISANREPSAAERKVLQARAAFRTGLVERLPSQLWTLESFKEMIENQEALYKIPLPRSYKKEVYKVFETYYVPSVSAFEAGDLLGARDLWIESLIFPIYRDDVMKHRAVALTMMKPFINDTLSKIGAVNNILMERQIRAKEEELNNQYLAFFELAALKKWNDVFQAIVDLEQKIDELEKPNLIVQGPPPYPQSIEKVDRDIRLTLFDLLNSPTPAVANLSPMEEDLKNKKKVVEGFLSATLEKQQETYDEAIDALGREDWSKARALLSQIDSPLALVKDAQEKIKVLKENKYLE